MYLAILPHKWQPWNGSSHLTLTVPVIKKEFIEQFFFLEFFFSNILWIVESRIRSHEHAKVANDGFEN